MAMTRTSQLFLLLFSLLYTKSHGGVLSKQSLIYPLACSNSITVKTCNSYLYHISRGFAIDDIAKFYAVRTSEVTSIKRRGKEDYLVSVPCHCESINGTIGYFYNTSYQVQPGDTLFNVTNEIYSGQVLTYGETVILAGEVIPMHLLCGCVSGKNEVVVTYTVQENDTVSSIANLLSSSVEEIQKLNKELSDPSFIDVGWVLFVPMADAAVPASSVSEFDNVREQLDLGEDIQSKGQEGARERQGGGT